MSLRPNFQAFRLSAMRRVIGIREADVEAELVQHFDRLVQPHDADRRELAHALIAQLVSGELERSPPREESETLAYVMIALASFRQTPEPSATLFWEDFLNRVDRAWREGSLAAGTERQLARYLLRGRPYFGEEIKTSWAYYACVPAAQIEELAEFVRSDRFADAYDKEQALAWLADVMRRELDLFFFAY